MMSEPLPASLQQRPAANKKGLQPRLSPLHPTLPVPCTAFNVDKACGVTSYDKPALSGVCVQGVEKQQAIESACTIIGALHTHIVCGITSAVACGVRTGLH